MPGQKDGRHGLRTIQTMVIKARAGIDAIAALVHEVSPVSAADHARGGGEPAERIPTLGAPGIRRLATFENTTWSQSP
jgi:hypothetical protein